MSVLFINACVRDNSRTLAIARKVLENYDCEIEEVVLNDLNISPLNKMLLSKRENLIKNNELNNEFFKLANQFSKADEIIIAAPFWDLSFPALLKTYFENITVSGITFCYNNGKPEGLCSAKKLTYVTTSGGKIFIDYGYNYIKTLALNFYGIKETICYKVEDLDVKMIDVKDVLKEKIIIVK